MLIRPDLPEAPSRPGDMRIGSLVREASEPIAVIVGFPSDRGVEINGGRPGAAAAPLEIRKALYKMTPGSPDMLEAWRRVVDLGDVRVSGQVNSDQDVLGDVLKAYLERQVVCLILGGGHETAFGHFLGYVKAGMEVEIASIDAHPDVREPVDGSAHSGSSFRLALQHPERPATAYTVFGLAPHSTAAEHLAVMDAHAGSRVWDHQTTVQEFDEFLSGSSRCLMVSVDLDAFSQSIAPGVSAPNPGGLPAEFGIRAAYSAGLSPRVASVDFSEVNPRFDVDGATARFTALLVWHFVEGLAARTGISRYLHSK